jgi:hypothetical protein
MLGIVVLEPVLFADQSLSVFREKQVGGSCGPDRLMGPGRPAPGPRPALGVCVSPNLALTSVERLPTASAPVLADTGDWMRKIASRV